MEFLDKDFIASKVRRGAHWLMMQAPPKKSILIESGFMGATKQLPHLLKELREVLPDIQVDIRLDDFHGHGKGKKALQQDLRQVDPALLEYIRIDPAFQVGYDLRAKFSMSSSREPSFEGSALQLWVEPLKFEKRPKLPDYKIDLIKSKYQLNGARIILAGAIHTDEIKEFCRAFDYASYHNPLRETVGIIVPRSCPAHMARIMSGEHINFEKDATIIRRGYRSHDKVMVTQNGILQELYSICDVTFVGDTLWTTEKIGGQNPIEPAFYGKKIVVGKNHTWNFDAYSGLAKSGLLVEVENQDELNRELATDFSPAELEKRVQAADEFIGTRQGSAKHYAHVIAQYITGEKKVPEFERPKAPATE